MARSSDLPVLRVAATGGDGATGPAAVEAIDAYSLEFDYLCRTLRRLGVGTADLEDMAHQVFIVLHQKWGEYDPTRPLRPYLFGIALRVASAYRRRNQRQVLGTFEDIADPAPQPDHLLSSARARQLVLLALEHIPLHRRAVFVMHDIDEAPMRAVAEALHIPLFTAYSRLRKARTEFRNAVKSIQGALR